MGEREMYESLAKKFDQGIVAAPMSDSLIEILKILFPGKEAEIALKLPFESKKITKLTEILNIEEQELVPILNRMAKQGTVFTEEIPSGETVYQLLPIVVGWSETPFWAGKDTETVRKLAPLWIKYREEAFGEELARNEMPLSRVIPISRSLKKDSEILPFDVLKSKLDNISYFAVAHCPCRQMARYTDRGCDHSLENCLHFDSMGKHMVAQGMAREITKEETLKIINEADQEGLVHVCDNIDGHLGVICNCCSCCCVFLNTKKEFDIKTFSPSNYVAQIEDQLCIGCGTCEERCPMEAVAVGEEDVAEVNEDLCIGCGVCTPTCPSEAVRLIQRKEINPPPDLNTFFTARFKAQA